MKRLYIVGAAEPGQEVLEVARTATEPFEFLGYFDDVMTGREIVNSVAELEKDACFVIAIGRTAARRRLFDLFVAAGLAPATIVSRAASVSDTARIAAGSVIFPQSVVSFNAEIDANVLINFHCSISHGVKIGPHCNITPGVHIAGNVTIGAECFLGIGSAIIEKVVVCPRVTLGANSTVIRNIDTPGTHVGTPAALVRRRE